MIGVYSWLKFLHVVAAIVWVGGAFTLSMISWQLSRAQDQAGLASMARLSITLGKIMIGPAMGLTLLAGMATAGSVGMSFGMLWITWGFGGILLSALFGGVLMRRTAVKMEGLAPMVEAGDGRLVALRRQMAILTWLNLAVLFSTVWAMVAKPML